MTRTKCVKLLLEQPMSGKKLYPDIVKSPHVGRAFHSETPVAAGPNAATCAAWTIAPIQACACMDLLCAGTVFAIVPVPP